ncbi:hypothetical protein KJ359_009822 [Pestalotiopsis sp. 9143b]|nr:hypothetical protein KJ359_009822 [Pestalotiopsis sp. 9143b]
MQHFIANEQEGNRKPWAETQSISSNIDDKTMHELYLWPFQDAVKAGTGSIMCSYQRVNNSYGCANSKTLNELLKTELGFQGFVVSDWDAQHAGLATALAGLDIAMLNGGSFWGDRLVEAVTNGSLPEERVTDMAIRIVAPWYQMNQSSAFPPLGIGMPASITLPHEVVDARDPNDRAVLLEGAIEGTVLVKNTKNTLPLQTPKMISIYGYSARSTDLFGITSDDYGYVPWTFGVEAVNFDEMVGSFVTGNFVGEHSVIARNGTILTGGGSGATTPAVFLSPFEALKVRAYQDGTAIFHDLVGSNPVVNPVTDVCIVFGNAWATETLDRPAIRDDYTDDLILQVADQCAKTVVVLHNAGIRLVDSFIDHDNVTAVLFAHLPGQESGPGIVSILYGESNPSGKLPYTVAKTEADYGSLLLPDVAEGAYVNFPQSDFEEGVYIDYRRFKAYNITPRFEFGFGLSYTTFNITELVVNSNPHVNASEWSRGDSVEGGRADLWDVIATMEVEVRNTGAVAGAEVPQLYVEIPGAPKKQPRGFEKVFLNAGESTTVQFPLRRRDLSVWDVVAQNWHLQKCTYQLFAGTSSEALPLSGELTV